MDNLSIKRQKKIEDKEKLLANPRRKCLDFTKDGTLAYNTRHVYIGASYI